MLTPAHRPVSCEACGNTMKAVRSLPRVGSFPELVTFKCEHCGHLDTWPVDEEDSQR
jgi:hypothetical protein